MRFFRTNAELREEYVQEEPELKPGWCLAECGYCALTPVDRCGQRDIVVNENCPDHGEGPS